MPRRRALRAALRLSPLEQRIRDRKADLYWALADAKRLSDATMGGVAGYSAQAIKDAEELVELCAKAQLLAEGLVELVKEREVPNG